MSIRVGCRVRLTDLCKRPDLNGEEVKVLSWNAPTARWRVGCLRGGHDGLLVLPEKMLPCPDSFGIIDDNCLLYVLAWTRADSHQDLRSVCLRFSCSVSSSTFAAQRIHQHLVEIKVALESETCEDDEDDEGDDEEEGGRGVIACDIGYRGSYSCTRAVAATVYADGGKAGSLAAFLIDRSGKCAQTSAAFESKCPKRLPAAHI